MTCGICVVIEILYSGCAVGMWVRGRGGGGGGVTVHGQLGHGDPDVILCKC